MRSASFLFGVALGILALIVPKAAGAQCFSYECALYYGYLGVQAATPYVQGQLVSPGASPYGYVVQQIPRAWGYTTWGPAYVTTPQYVIPQPVMRYSAPAYGYPPPVPFGFRR